MRKHVATMSQILNLSPSDMEQLATYMGHDISIHKQYYRLPENTFQVDKISKVLLRMEKGKIQNLNDKTLNDDLNINLEHEENEEISSDDEELQPSTSFNSTNAQNPITCNEEQHSVSKQQRTRKEIRPTTIVKKRKSCVKRPWSEQEKEAVLRHFSKHIIMKQVPNKKECDSCLKSEPVLISRTWAHVKFFVKNMFNRKDVM